MTEYLNLTEFVPGTKAKAEDVNANFTVIKNAIGECALADGNVSSTFNVADGTADSHAVNKKQLDGVLAKTINSMKFCCNNGVTTNGIPSILSLANNIITLNSNGALLTDSLGTNITLDQDLTLDVSGITGTIYLYYNSSDKTLFKTANKHVFAYSRPSTPVEDLIYIYVNNNNWAAEIYKNSTWKTLNGVVYLGYYVLANNVGTVTTNPYNQNDYDINMFSTVKSKSPLALSSISNSLPDYANGVNQPWCTNCKADRNGFIKVIANNVSGCNASMYIDSILIWSQSAWNGDAQASGMIPISRGSQYIAQGGSSGQILVFYPMKGEE